MLQQEPAPLYGWFKNGSLSVTHTHFHHGALGTLLHIFPTGPGCRAAIAVSWKREGEPQRSGDWMCQPEQNSHSHSQPRTSLWSHAITRGQRVQLSLCTEGEDTQYLQGALWTTIVLWGSSGPTPSGFRWGNAAGTEQQHDLPHVTQLAKWRGHRGGTRARVLQCTQLLQHFPVWTSFL